MNSVPSNRSQLVDTLPGIAPTASVRHTPKGTRPAPKRHHWAGRRWVWVRAVRERCPRHLVATALALAEASSDDTAWVPSPG